MKDISSNPPYMLVFDIDGVITDPQLKKVTEPKILDEIITRLKAGIPVAFNTGRSVKWVEENIIEPLKGHGFFEGNDLTKLVFISAEKGGSWAYFGEGGKLIKLHDTSILISNELKEKISGLVREKYGHCAFYDETKEVMISVEMKDGYSLEVFREEEKELFRDMEKIVSEQQLPNPLKFEVSIIAIDIESEKLGKDLGARRILEWLGKLNIKPQEFIAFGDSKTDMLTASELFNNGYKTTFVFLGDNKGPIEDYKFEIVQPKEKYTRGTLEFLEKTKRHTS